MTRRTSHSLKKSSSNRRLAVECLEHRQLMTASMGWDGPGMGSAELKYYIGNAPASISQSEFEQAIESALDAWSDVADITFVRTNQAGENHSLDFTSRYLDGQFGTLAQAYFPDDVNPSRIAGDVVFDSSESWELGNLKGNSAFDLIYVAVHEIGHSLGLDHTEEAGSVLLPTVTPNQQFTGLDETDIEEIQRLYAPANTIGDENEASNNPASTDPIDTIDNQTTSNTNDTSNQPSRRTQIGPTWYSFGWNTSRVDCSPTPEPSSTQASTTRLRNNFLSIPLQWTFQNRVLNVGRFEIQVSRNITWNASRPDTADPQSTGLSASEKSSLIQRQSTPRLVIRIAALDRVFAQLFR